MIKKIWAILASFCIAVCLFSVVVQAEELQEGDYKYRILEDGTAEITEYTGSETDIVTPSTLGEYTVTSIGEYAFYENLALNNLYISEGITTIDSYAFRECENLSNISFPNSLKRINGVAFSCTNITDINLPNGLEYVGANSFSGCHNLKNIVLPNSLTHVPAWIFAHCTSLENVVLPEGITYIGDSAFEGCSSLSNINFPNALESIQAYAFKDCTNLTSISIPKSVTVIGGNAFLNCSALTDVVLSEGLENIHHSAFKGCTGLTKIIFPAGLKIISYNVFAGCTSLERVEIPDTITMIDRNAFGECSSLTDVYYTATEQEWETISIVDRNEYLINAALHFNSSMPLFADVASTEWFYDAIDFVYKNSIMTGLNANTFGPYDTLVRAQFASVLYSANNLPDVTFEAKFSDVAEGDWYADAVIWANKNSIVNGYGSGTFGPGDAVTREQMTIMMYNYAAIQGYAINQRADISRFTDAELVSWYAEAAMQWAVGTGVITGKDGGTRLDPQGSTSRAECAAIIQRFMENNSDQSNTNQTGTWVCNERVGAPSNYSGGTVKLVLEQTVDGSKQEKTIMEGESITFPYQLNLVGAKGVTSGKVYMYELVDGTYKLRCNWPVIFSQI